VQCSDHSFIVVLPDVYVCFISEPQKKLPGPELGSSTTENEKL